MRLHRLWVRLLAALSSVRFTDTTVMGVPNLVQIAPRLWRMGQPEPSESPPAANDSWGYLARTIAPNGERVVLVKLNDDKEGVDTPPPGWWLLKRPLPPEDDKPWSVLLKPDPKVVWAIVDEIVAAYQLGDVVVWHCTHGRDRTGLITALVGMRLLGWSKGAAWANMLAHGFRWELPDLDVFWLENVH